MAIDGEASCAIQEFVRMSGETVNTEECADWQKEHKSCSGCPSELGCKKVQAIKVVVSPLMKNPESARLHDRAANLINLILKSEDVEELNKIVFT